MPATRSCLNGAVQQAAPQAAGNVRPAPPSQAVVQVVPNPQSELQIEEKQESPQQCAADMQALQQAILQFNAWAAKLPHGNPPQAEAEDADDTSGAPVSMAAALAWSTQYVGVVSQAPAVPAVSARGYNAPPRGSAKCNRVPPAVAICSGRTSFSGGSTSRNKPNIGSVCTVLHFSRWPSRVLYSLSRAATDDWAHDVAGTAARPVSCSG
ncbi:hypothetical protein P3T23_008084 [Paraburkholderia sp. GAS448]